MLIGIDIFSGAGGLSLGAEMAGIQISYGIEINPSAAKSFTRNHKGAKVLQGDIRDIDPSKLKEGNDTVFIIMGGPPCQGFSLSNTRTRNMQNANNFLFLEFVRFVQELKPTWFVLENVWGLTNMEEGKTKNMIEDCFRALGYEVSSKVLWASDYGVPQNRNRFFMVGNRHGIKFEFPEPFEKKVTVEEALLKFETLHPELILLDIMLPGLDGWQVCREIRKKSQVPIIMLTAKGETFDKVLGLELGADDYVVKPFDTKEIIARIKAVLRRIGQNNQQTDLKEVSYDKLVVNMTRYELKVDGKIIDTPPKELELLYHLASNPNRVYTRDQLLDEVWGFEYYGDSRTIDVHVKRLREKLEGVSDKWSLKTVWGVGYKFEVVDLL